MIHVTKEITPVNIILGLSHVLHGLVMVLSLGILRTDFPHKTAMYMARMQMRAGK